MSQNTCQNEDFGCNIDFGRSADLGRHEDEQHFPPKQCPWCKFTDRRYHKVIAHVGTCHGNGVYRYPNKKCAWSWCEFVESRDSILREHMTVRHPRRPYNQGPDATSHQSLAEHLMSQEQSQASFASLLGPADSSPTVPYTGSLDEVMRDGSVTSTMMSSQTSDAFERTFQRDLITNTFNHDSNCFALGGQYPLDTPGHHIMQPSMLFQSCDYPYGLSPVPFAPSYGGPFGNYPLDLVSSPWMPSYPAGMVYLTPYNLAVSDQSMADPTSDSSWIETAPIDHMPGW